jgi:nucleoside-diphosphate-sugar epimerase
MAAAIDGMDVVLHLAAHLHVPRPTALDLARFEAVNVRATADLARAAATASVSRFIYFSSIAVYGSTPPGSIADETTAPRPETPYAETKLRGESEVLSIAGSRGHPSPGVVLRLAAVYGERLKGNWDRLFRALARRRYFPIGAGRNRRTLVFDEDVAEAAWLAATSDAARGKIYNVTDGYVHEVCDVVAAMSRALGRVPPRFALPISVVRPVFAGIGGLCRLVHVPPPVDGDTLSKYLEDVAVSGELLRRELGFEPRFDLDAGWRRVVRDFASHEAARSPTDECASDSAKARGSDEDARSAQDGGDRTGTRSRRESPVDAEVP